MKTTRSDEEKSIEETIGVAERDWFKRAYPIRYRVPASLRYEIEQLLRHYPAEIANAVLFIYKHYGVKFAKDLARKILTSMDVPDIVFSLTSVISRLDVEERKLLNEYLFRFVHSLLNDELLARLEEFSKKEMELSESEKQKVIDLSVEIFIKTMNEGVVIPPEFCIEYALWKLGLKQVKTMNKTKKSYFEAIERALSKS